VLAHADGSWKTAVDYQENANIWYQDMLRGDDLIHDLLNGYTNDESSLTEHIGFVDELAHIGIKSTSSASRNSEEQNDWSPVRGYQALPSIVIGKEDEWLVKFRNLSTLISTHLGLRPLAPQNITGRFSGSVKIGDPAQIARGGFDQFCENEEVFSHAIVSKKAIRYTKGLVGRDRSADL